MKLNYLLFLTGLVMFSNQAVYAQNEFAAIIPSDLCSGLTASKIGYKSHSGTMDKESEFVAMNKKYYLKVVERKGTIPIVFNSAFGNYNFPGDSTKRLETKEFYLQKSKNQKTAAWVLLGAGTAMVIGGAIGFGNQPFWGDEASNRRSDFYGYILLAGLLSDLASIPLFVSASKNKKRASTLSFGNRNIYSLPDKSFCRNIYPSLTLRIKL